MKKIMLFSLICATGFSFAGAQIISTALPDSKEIKLDEPVKLDRYVPNAAPQLKEDLNASYKAPQGTLLIGIGDDFIPYSPAYVGGGSEETPWYFKNTTTGADESTTYTWNVAGTVVKGDPAINNDLSVILPLGSYDTPILNAVKEKTKSTYQYGTQLDIKGEKPSAKLLVVSSAEVLKLTNADYNYGGNYAIFDNEHYAMGSGDLGLPGFPFITEKDGFKVLDEEPLRAKGVVTYFEKPMSPLVVKSISIPGYSFSKRPLADDATLTLEIRKLDENGRVDLTGEPLETSKATALDVTEGKPGDYGFNVEFSFTEIGDFGLPVEKEFFMDQACAVVITGFDQEGCDFGVYCANAMGPERCGTSWLILEDGTLGTFIFKEEEQKPRFNAYVHLKGFYPYLHPMCEYVNVPDEGGKAEYVSEGERYSPQFISNFPAVGDNAVEIVSDIPDWLEVTPYNTAFETYRTIVYIVEGEPLPSGVTSRTATLVLSNHGFTKSIQINQGEAAISTTAADQYKVVRNGNDFVLSYPAGATSVMVVNALGQNVAQYDLPAGGQTTIPAAVLSNGLNIFKFNGAGNIAVKAMK